MDDLKPRASAPLATSDSSQKNARQKMIKVLITKSLLACLRDPMEPEPLAATAAAWAELLGGVPTDQLNTCYLDAWKRPEHKPGFPVTADEILAAYQERRNRPRPLPQAADVIAQLRAHRYARKSDE